MGKEGEAHGAGLRGVGNLADISRSECPNIDVCVTTFTARSRVKTMQFVTRRILDGRVAFISLSNDFKTDILASQVLQ